MLLPFLINKGTNNDLSNYYGKSEVDALILSQTAPRRNALAPRGGVAFDGTANSRVTTALAGQTIGTDPFAIHLVARIPATSQAYTGLCHLGPSQTQTNNNSGTFAAYFVTTNLVFEVYGANGARGWTVPISDLMGKEAHIAFVRESASSLKLYVNGVERAGTLSTYGSVVPADFSVSITSTYFTLAGAAYAGAWLASTVRSASLYNLALTASDVLEIYELGGGVPERFKFGSNANLITNANATTFDTGVAIWALNTGSPTVSWDAGNQRMAITAPGTGQVYAHQVGGAMNYKKGSVFRVRFTVSTLAVGGPITIGAMFGGTYIGNTLNVNAVGTYVFDIVLPADHSAYANGGGLAFGWTGAVDFSVDNVSLMRVGAVVHLPLDDGLGFQLQDISTNRLHALMTATGAAHVAPLYGPARYRGTSNTNGNQQLGGQVVIPADSQIVRIRARARTNTPTVTLGSTSGGTQIVASVALTTSWKDLTIALAGGLVGSSSSISLWAGSNSTDVVEWDLTWEPLST